MFEKLLVANRGEIARRVLGTATRMGIRTVAVYSQADTDLPFVHEADEAVLLGDSGPADSYNNSDRILEAARRTRADAVHPGYGFLSENAEFAAAVQQAGLGWVGPAPEAIAAMGDKIQARNILADAGFPVSAGGRTPTTQPDEAVAIAERIGYPVMLKPAAGGGGLGMTAAADSDAVAAQLERLSGFAARTFGDPAVLIERYFPVARHIEVQILGLADGRVIALGERDCSVQRRNQKLVEETPSPGLTPQLRERMLAAAVLAGQTVGYRNAGTVECLVEPATQDFVFLEMNTRLQVEHPITEAVTGIDIVEQQLRIAAQEQPTFDPDGIRSTGHAVELRVNAEDPARFLPGPGTIQQWKEPDGPGIRVDAGYEEATTVTAYYDSLMAKLVVYGRDRGQALRRAAQAVSDFEIIGPKHNLDFFAELLTNTEFASGHYDTGIIGRMR
jgi:acetyl-CoA carboxylase biotin carboxylase subunit